MKATEKQILFELIKTSSSYVNGYTKQVFNSKIEFTDDKTLPTSLSIDQLDAKIQKCTRCPLATNRTSVSIGKGVVNPEVLIIKDNSLTDQNMQANEDSLLNKMISSINLSCNNNCYITNYVKCQPHANRETSETEQEACYSFLEAQIKVLKPKIIFCMGRLCTCRLLKTQDSIGNLRGQFFDYNNIPLIASYTPNALIKNPELKKNAWEDLKTLRIKLNQLNNL